MKAKNRIGQQFEVSEKVMLADYPIQYPTMKGAALIIDEIVSEPHCESGFMLLVTHEESKQQFKRFMDTNWFQKYKS